MNGETSGWNGVPRMLKFWFVLHFAVDMMLAVPLFIAPVFTLEALGLQAVDPYASRIAAAALFGIGIESLLGRNGGIQAYRGMLNLKIIWSAGAIIGLLLTFAEGGAGRPFMVIVLALIFIIFNIIWVYWRIQVGKRISGSPS